jgi:hypothetical protein
VGVSANTGGLCTGKTDLIHSILNLSESVTHRAAVLWKHENCVVQIADPSREVRVAARVAQALGTVCITVLPSGLHCLSGCVRASSDVAALYNPTCLPASEHPGVNGLQKTGDRTRITDTTFFLC